MSPNNHFQNVVDELQSCTPQQRYDRLIDGIAHELQKSGNTQTRDMGSELEQAKPRIIQALQTPQGQSQGQRVG